MELQRTLRGLGWSRREAAPVPLVQRVGTTSLLQRPASINLHQVFAAHKPQRCSSTSAPRSQRLSVTARATKQAVTFADSEFFFEDLGGCQRRVTVTVPGPVCQDTFTKTVETLRKDVVGRLAGFRADKVPLSMVVQQVGGQSNFKGAIIEAILEGTQPEMVARLGPDVVPNSERITTDMREKIRAFDPAKSFSYSMEYEVVPPIKWRSSYRDITVTLQETGNFSTDEVAAAALVRERLKSKGHQNVAIDHGLEPGMVCIVDMDIRTPGAKEPLPGMNKDRLNLDTEVDPLGLVDGMAGMRVGETRTFPITLPDDHPVDEWQGMVCSATIKLRELLSWNLPKPILTYVTLLTLDPTGHDEQFDDDFVAQHYPQYKTAVAMTQALIAETTARRMQERDMQLQLGVREAVVGCLDMPHVPDSLVEQYGAREYKARLLMMVMEVECSLLITKYKNDKERKATLEELERQATDEMIDEFVKAKREDLEGLVRFSLAIDDIAAAEGLHAGEKEIEAVYKLKAQQFQESKVEFDPDNLRNEVTETIKEAKVVEWLKDNVKTTTLPYVPSAAPQKLGYPQATRT